MLEESRGGMRYLLLSLAALLCSMALLLMGSGLLGSAMALRMELERFPTATIGTVMACYSVGFVAASVTWGRAIARIGHIRAFTALAALCAASTLAYPLLIAPVAWGLLRAAFGFCLAGLYMVAESWLNHRAPRRRRGRVLAWYSITTYGALGGGQFLLNSYPPQGFELFSLAAALFALAVVPIAMTRAPAPTVVAVHPMSPRQLFGRAPLAVAGSVTSGAIVGAFLALGPVFGRQVGLETPGISLLMGGALIGGLLMQWPVGHLSDSYGRSLTIMVAAGVLAVLSVMVAFVSATRSPWLIGVAVAWGGLVFTIYPLSLALAADRMAPEALVSAGAALLLVNGGGMIAGPLVISLLMQWIGPSSLFGAAALGAFSLSAYAYRRRHTELPLPADQQADFVQMPSTTPFAAALDPRAEGPQLELPLEARAPARS